ncbi:MAG: FAD-dependent oxidoreductase [Acidobacteriaceae bacterium]
MNRSDVAIAGAGIIGLATALEFSTAGLHVTVFDQSEAMSEASRAAAGMLAGNDPENPPELQALALLSLRLYPDFLARVEHLSGRKIPIRTTSTLQGSEHLPSGKQALGELEIQNLAPGAHTAGLRFFRIDETSFDAWDLAEALPSAVRAAGIDLREHTAVLRVNQGSSSVELETSAGWFSADRFLNAAGAWSPSLDPALPVFPRKGHMLTAELPGELQMQCVLRNPKVYIVPRGGNRYTVGSTVEDAAFDRVVYTDRIHELFARAVELWPPLRDASIAETWIGFRPGSEDGLPILDQTAERCWVATGHFKNGILLGPGTGRVLSQWMIGSQPEIDLAPFRCARFATSPLSS